MEKITGKTKLLALLASPARHSLSPALHNAALQQLGLDYVYLAFDVPEGGLKEAVEGLRALGAAGWNLSMPHKQAMLEYLDEIDPRAALIGSVNTVVNRQGRLIGYNTDAAGFLRALREREADLSGKKALLFGGGGAGLAVIAALLSENAALSVFNRRGDRLENLEKWRKKLPGEQAERLCIFPLEEEKALREEMGRSDIYINATPLGMKANLEKSPAEDSALFRRGALAFDLIYEPEKTRFLEIAEAAGCRIENGKSMLFYQAAEAFLLWTGKDMPQRRKTEDVS